MPHPAEAPPTLTRPKSNAQAEPEQPTPSKISVDPSPKKVQPTRKAKKTKKSTHPRYAITIVGCSNIMYDVIELNEKDKYAALLTSRDICDEHLREGDVFGKSVLRLKAYWTKDAQFLPLGDR